MYDRRGFTCVLGCKGWAARAAAIFCSRSVIGGVEGKGAPDSCKKFSSSVGTFATPVGAGTGVVGATVAFVTIGASTGTRTSDPQPGQGSFSPAYDSSHWMCWAQDGQENFRSLIINSVLRFQPHEVTYASSKLAQGAICGFMKFANVKYGWNQKQQELENKKPQSKIKRNLMINPRI